MTRSAPTFGRVELDLEEDAGAAPDRLPSFGELDLDAILGALDPEGPPASGTRVNDAVTRCFAYVERAPRESRPPASHVTTRDDRVAAMRELYAQGNTDAALALAAEVASALDAEPDPFDGLLPVDVEVRTAIVEAFEDGSPLAVMTSRAVPRRLLGPRAIADLPMDPRAAFVLGHIDGVQTMEEILDVCAMPEAEALTLIERLRLMGVIDFVDAPRRR